MKERIRVNFKELVALDFSSFVTQDVGHVMITPALERQDILLGARNGFFIVEFGPRAVVSLHPRHVVTAVGASTLCVNTAVKS